VSLDEEVEEVQVLDFENYDTKDWVMDGVQFDFSDGYANGKQNRTEIEFFIEIICRILFYTCFTICYTAAILFKQTIRQILRSQGDKKLSFLTWSFVQYFMPVAMGNRQCASYEIYIYNGFLRGKIDSSKGKERL
jgi:hypothetical protein